MTGGDRNDDGKKLHPVISKQQELLMNDTMTAMTVNPETLLASKRKDDPQNKVSPKTKSPACGHRGFPNKYQEVNMKSSQERQNSNGKYSHKNYYEDLIESSDIGEIARELIPDRITDETYDKLFCDCPNHAGISKTSLHMDVNKQLWHCWGCNQGGDVIQLVEFIQSGQVSKGVKG